MSLGCCDSGSLPCRPIVQIQRGTSQDKRCADQLQPSCEAMQNYGSAQNLLRSGEFYQKRTAFIITCSTCHMPRACRPLAT